MKQKCSARPFLFPILVVVVWMLSFSSPVEAAPVVQIPDVSDRLQTILQDPDRSNKYRYPTDLTRGILPVRMRACQFVCFRCRCRVVSSRKFGRCFSVNIG